MMIEDPKVAWPAKLTRRARRHRQRSGLHAPHHGRVDGGADPSLQDGDRGRRGAGRARCTRPVESPRGELGFYVVSTGEHRPYRVKIRDPSFVNLQAIADDGRGLPRRRRDRGDRLARPRDGRGGPLMAIFEGDRLDEARAIMARYPDGRAAIRGDAVALPRAVGRGPRHAGQRCRRSPTLIGVRTAEVEAVASFYTMLRLRPTGTHLIAVCTNLSCALRGANDVYERRARRHRHPPRRRGQRRRRVQRARRGMPRRLRARARRAGERREPRPRHARTHARDRRGACERARCPSPPGVRRSRASRRRRASWPGSSR